MNRGKGAISSKKIINEIQWKSQDELTSWCVISQVNIFISCMMLNNFIDKQYICCFLRWWNIFFLLFRDLVFHYPRSFSPLITLYSILDQKLLYFWFFFYEISIICINFLQKSPFSSLQLCNMTSKSHVIAIPVKDSNGHEQQVLREVHP